MRSRLLMMLAVQSLAFVFGWTDVAAVERNDVSSLLDGECIGKARIDHKVYLPDALVDGNNPLGIEVGIISSPQNGDYGKFVHLGWLHAGGFWHYLMSGTYGGEKSICDTPVIASQLYRICEVLRDLDPPHQEQLAWVPC